MNRKESRPKAADKNSQAHHTAPLYRLRRRHELAGCPAGGAR
jgi:hypothetical protein